MGLLRGTSVFVSTQASSGVNNFAFLLADLKRNKQLSEAQSESDDTIDGEIVSSDPASE